MEGKGTMSGLATLYVVIPCYNEEKVLPVTAPMFLEKIKSLRGGQEDFGEEPDFVCR